MWDGKSESGKERDVEGKATLGWVDGELNQLAHTFSRLSSMCVRRPRHTFACSPCNSLSILVLAICTHALDQGEHPASQLELPRASLLMEQGVCQSEVALGHRCQPIPVEMHLGLSIVDARQ